MTAPGLFDDDDWGRVVTSTGEYARVDALAGHLIIVIPIGYIEHSPTRFSTSDKKSDAIVCDVVDLDDVDETGMPGKLYRNTWWRAAQLILSLRPKIGSKVLGVIGRGVAKNGMNAPWVIDDMSQNPELVERARQWGRTHSDYVVSPFQPPTAPRPQHDPYPQGYNPFPQGAMPAPPRYPQQQPGYSPSQQGGGNYQAPPQQGYMQQGGYQQPPAPGPYGPPPGGYTQQQTGYANSQGNPGYSAPAPGNYEQSYQQPPQPQGYPQQGPPAPPPAPPQPVSTDEANMLAAMRARRQAEYQQQPGYTQPQDPPF